MFAGWVFMQADPQPTPVPGGNGGGGGPGIDIGQLVNGIVNGLLNGLGDALTKWVTTLGGDVATFLRDTITNLWNAIWTSGANVLNTPFELTIDFPPARILGRELTTVVYAIAVLAVVLLGLRILWRTMSNSAGSLNDAVNGVLLGFLLAAVATLIIGQAFLLTVLGSDAIGRQSYAPAFNPHTLLSIGPDFALSLFTLVVMIIYGWRLILRAAYRIVLLMFLAPFAPVAGVLWAIPQVRWVSVLYWVTIGGWLAGGFLAIGAVSLAVQIATVGNVNNGLQSLVFGVALIQVAYDLMGILPKGASGGISVGSPFGALLAGVTGGAVGAAAIAGGAVGASAAGAGASAAAGMGSANIAGALSSGGERAGYGYE